MSDPIIGEVISAYTRAEAIEDGVLIDVSDTPAGELFRFPVAFTAALTANLRKGRGKNLETFYARAWDVGYMMTLAAKCQSGPDVYFGVRVGNRNLRLRGNCGPGDGGEPVVTVGFPGDF